MLSFTLQSPGTHIKNSTPKRAVGYKNKRKRQSTKGVRLSSLGNDVLAEDEEEGYSDENDEDEDDDDESDGSNAD